MGIPDQLAHGPPYGVLAISGYNQKWKGPFTNQHGMRSCVSRRNVYDQRGKLRHLGLGVANPAKPPPTQRVSRSVLMKLNGRGFTARDIRKE